MKTIIGNSWKTLALLGVFALIAAGAHAIASRPAVAGTGQQCGPIRQWDCTLKNGKHEIVMGTVCDIQKYEKKKHATCQ
jgi:hypothetical protein